METDDPQPATEVTCPRCGGPTETETTIDYALGGGAPHVRRLTVCGDPECAARRGMGDRA